MNILSVAELSKSTHPLSLVLPRRKNAKYLPHKHIYKYITNKQYLEHQRAAFEIPQGSTAATFEQDF